MQTTRFSKEFEKKSEGTEREKAPSALNGRTRGEKGGEHGHQREHAGFLKKRNVRRTRDWSSRKKKRRRGDSGRHHDKRSSTTGKRKALPMVCAA